MQPGDVARMRREYVGDGLDESDAGDDPFVLFDRWFAEALESGVHEPNAMALATADADAVPAVRIVLLKGLDRDGAVFYTNYDSAKGHDLAANPRAAGVMLWHSMQRQVRFSGPVAKVPAAQSDAYFAARPRGAQLGAVASEQSTPIASRAALEKRLQWVETTAGDDPVTRPDHWGGYRIAIESIEFWCGRADRLHDRLRYTRDGEVWRRERLSP